MKGIDLKKGAEQVNDIVEQVGAEELKDTIKCAADVVRKEYGDFKLTKGMKKKLAKELGEPEETVDAWQKVGDVLDHIDVAVLAKKHPEAIGKVAGMIIAVLSCFFPAVGAIGGQMPGEFLAKLVEFAGLLTPEHIANIIVKNQIERKQRKKEKLLAAGETLELTDGETEKDFVLITEAEDGGTETPPIEPDEIIIEPAMVEIEASVEPAPKNNGFFNAVCKKVAAGSKQMVNGGKKGVEKVSGMFRKKPEQEDVFESIRKLAQLKETGILTEDEFEAKKTELLARI